MGTIKQKALSQRFIPKSQKTFVEAVLGDDRLLRALIGLEEQLACDVPSWLRKSELGGFCVRVPPGYFENIVEEVVWLCSERQASVISDEASTQAKLELCQRRLAENTREYLREVTAYRDRLAERTRAFEGEHEVVEEELYVYEPLQYFEKYQQKVMREVIDERVRQLLSRRPDKLPEERMNGAGEVSDEFAELAEDLAAQQGKFRDMKASHEASLKAKREAEKALAATKEELKAANELVKESRKEAGECYQQFKRMEVEKEKLEQDLAKLRRDSELTTKQLHEVEEMARRQTLEASTAAQKLAAAQASADSAAAAAAAAKEESRKANSLQQNTDSTKRLFKHEEEPASVAGASPDDAELERRETERRNALRQSDAERQSAIADCEKKFNVERVGFRKTIADLNDAVSALKLRCKNAEAKCKELEDGSKSKKGKRKLLQDGLVSTQLSRKDVFIRLHKDAIERLCRLEDFRGKASVDRELDLLRTILKQCKETGEDTVADGMDADITRDRGFRRTITKPAQLSIVSALEEDPEREDSLQDTVKLKPTGMSMNSTTHGSTRMESLVQTESPALKPQRQVIDLDDRSVVAQIPLEVHFPEPSDAEQHLAETLKPLHSMSRPSSSPGLGSTAQLLKRPASSPGLLRMRPYAAHAKTKSQTPSLSISRGRMAAEDSENVEQARLPSSILWKTPPGPGMIPSNSGWRLAGSK